MKQVMTTREAVDFAGCSASTLKRHCCGLCERTLLSTLMWGCSGVSYFNIPPCNPKDKRCYPWKRHGEKKPKASEPRAN